MQGGDKGYPFICSMLRVKSWSLNCEMQCFCPLFLFPLLLGILHLFLELIQHKTIDSVLARGEKLDSLVEKSSDLSAASQVSKTTYAVGFGIHS